MVIFGTLLEHWKAIALATVVAAALIYRTVLVHQRDGARAQVTTLTGAAAVLQADNTSMAAAVARQNAAVAALQGQMKVAESTAANREATYAANAARTMGKEIARANAIRTVPIPASCVGAIDWANAQGPGLGRW